MEDMVKRISDTLGAGLDAGIVSTISEHTGLLVQEIFDDALEICLSEKRKIVTLGDIRRVVRIRNLTILDPLFPSEHGDQSS